MEQFSLEKYLENPSRKVMTRQGKSVRIICTDRRHTDSWPIVALEDYGDGEFVIYANIDGRTDMCSENIHDLFFADKEEELTEFEGGLFSLVSEFWQKYALLEEEVDIAELVKENSKELLDLARKELEPELDKKLKEAYNQGGLDTQEEITKCLPKWKKAKKDEELDCHVAIQQDDRVVLSDFVQKDEYYITLDVLNRLPKEE